MAKLTKNSTETTRNSRKQKYCVGMEDFLGQEPVRSKIVVHNKFLQQVKILNNSVVEFPMKINRVLKTGKIRSNSGKSKQNF
jgi:hypothetical protein